MFIGLIALLFLVEVFGIAPKAHAAQARCPTVRIPDEKFHGANIARNGEPIYKLTIGEKSDRLENLKTYTLRLQGQSHKKFRDAVLVVEAENKTCGTGSFVSSSKYLYQPTGCPHVISTNRKQKMGRTTFDWTAPECGCVLIRAVVISGKGVYYSGNSNSDDDSLTVSKCIKADVKPQRETEQATMPPASLRMVTKTRDGRGNPPQVQTWEDKLETLCRTTEHHGGASLSESRHFRHRHQLTVVSDSRFEHIKLILENRRSDIKNCCSKNGRYRNDCIGDIRRRRIDSFCAKGEPDIPFSKTSVEWMRDRENQCCWVFGGERYQCFSESTKNGMDVKQGYLVNEQDEFDPVNDLDDYPIQSQPEQERRQKEEQNDRGIFDGKLRKTTSRKVGSFLTTKSTIYTPRIRKNKPTNVKSANLRMDYAAGDDNSGEMDQKDTSSRINVIKHQELRETYTTSTTTGASHISTTHHSSTTPATPHENPEETTKVDGQSTSTEMILNKRRHTGIFRKFGLAVLEKKAWKANLKLVCCNKGQEEGVDAISADELPKCKHSARKYSEEMSRGKRLCISHFRLCCENVVSKFSRKAEKHREFIDSHRPSRYSQDLARKQKFQSNKMEFRKKNSVSRTSERLKSAQTGGKIVPTGKPVSVKVKSSDLVKHLKSDIKHQRDANHATITPTMRRNSFVTLVASTQEVTDMTIVEGTLPSPDDLNVRAKGTPPPVGNRVKQGTPPPVGNRGSQGTPPPVGNRDRQGSKIFRVFIFGAKGKENIQNIENRKTNLKSKSAEKDESSHNHPNGRSSYKSNNVQGEMPSEKNVLPKSKQTSSSGRLNFKRDQSDNTEQKSTFSILKRARKGDIKSRNGKRNLRTNL